MMFLEGFTEGPGPEQGCKGSYRGNLVDVSCCPSEQPEPDSKPGSAWLTAGPQEASLFRETPTIL